MKKINKYSLILTILTGMFVFSCSDQLNIDPISNDIIQPDFTDIGDIESALGGVYSGFKAGSQYTGRAISLGDWPADDLTIAQLNTGQGAIIHEWDYVESDDNVEGAWVGAYAIVRRANFVIEGVQEFDGAETTLANQFLAEAQVLKSLSLIHLHKVFGERYQDGNELSVPYVNEANNITQELPRLSANSLLDSIINDVTESIPNLSDDFNPNRVTKSLAFGILARAAMFRNDWSSVVLNSTQAIDASGVSLSNTSDFGLMWGENDEDIEAIFKIALDPDDNTLSDAYWTDGVGPRFDPSNDLLTLYESDDVRLESYFVTDPTDGFIIGKYYGPATQRGFHEPFVMRMAEFYLMRAEANFELGNESDALSDLNFLRTNRSDSFVDGSESGDDLREAIRTERRKEFAYEGFRFYDLKRWGLEVNRRDCTADECTLSANNFRFTYPIPRAELFANENMVQNLGY